ncbi:hypothetical protein NBH15_03450 [Parabacteroides sp. W1-Q-101]|uniref:hypothetical protein n=1 Tax=Parabacteroides caeci TaxID=2949650 RepID=UPI0020301B71|nr:hypothetical protein [Parabacteroides sp. W1-Q-101]MCM0717327.1 hypothetical protein [Parabacteroides sp. W1-Q-101]
MNINYASPGDVGLIYTDENGAYHLLALSRHQHEALNIFVRALTQEQPTIMAEDFEVIIRKKE